MKLFRFGLMPLAAYLAVVCAVRAETGNAEEGMAVFKQRCATCHEVEAGVNKVGHAACRAGHFQGRLQVCLRLGR